MKKTLLLLASMALFICIHAQDTIRVNNTGASADYSTLVDAHNAASDGDVIYLENSPTSYGVCDFTKQLTVIGMGYYLGENDSTPAQKAGSIVGQIRFYTGSEGSIIQGIYSDGITTINTDSIIIRRCNLYSFVICDDGSAANCIVEQNFIRDVSYEGGTGDFSNLIFSNNILNRGFSMDVGSSGTFRNNIFDVGNNSSNYFYNSTVENNIFYVHGINALSSNNSVQYNIFAESGTDANANQYGITMSDVFELTGSTDGQYQLKEGSPAEGAASDGGDCGPFGGTNPYKLSGMPPIPYIYNAIIPTSGSTSGGLNVQVKIRSND